MKIYLAPLEGITTYVFRNAVNACFGGADKFFTPFFSPQTKRHAGSFPMQGILPSNNEGLRLVPQMLTDDAEDFLNWERDMHNYGYDEINLNLGCPSGTVVSKNRGAGALGNPESLDALLDGIYSKTKARVSVKTRLGMHDAEEFYRLLEIYNQYPMEELIIHARVKDEMYGGHVHRDVYDWAKAHSKNRLVYNGDIFKPGDVNPADEVIMLGRGMVADPSLARRIKGGPAMTKAEQKEFLRMLKTKYIERDPDERHCLEKLKEVCSYMGVSKGVMKSKRLEEYQVELDKWMRETD